VEDRWLASGLEDCRAQRYILTRHFLRMKDREFEDRRARRSEAAAFLDSDVLSA